MKSVLLYRWEPIETAPRDGTDILVCVRYTDTCLVVDWDDAAPQSGWNWATLDGPYYHSGLFSHWMPLPPPPHHATERMTG